jgi:hypothetical protein
MVSLPSTQWECIGSLNMLGYGETKSPTNSQETDSVQNFVGPVPSLGVSRQTIKIWIKRWVDNQHLVMNHGLSSIQRQAQKPILGPSLTTKTRFLFHNRIQSRVISLRNEHNTLRRHLHLMGLP